MVIGVIISVALIKFRHIYFVITNNILYRSKVLVTFRRHFPENFTSCTYRNYNYYFETTFIFSNEEYCRENNFSIGENKEHTFVATVDSILLQSGGEESCVARLFVNLENVTRILKFPNGWTCVWRRITVFLMENWTQVFVWQVEINFNLVGMR